MVKPYSAVCIARGAIVCIHQGMILAPGMVLLVGGDSARNGGLRPGKNGE